jgi:hypothetical protein
MKIAGEIPNFALQNLDSIMVVTNITLPQQVQSIPSISASPSTCLEMVSPLRMFLAQPTSFGPMVFYSEIIK